jgi:riboflavin synthase
MFSGIVEGMGRIVEVTERETTRRFAIQAPFGPELAPGDSVAVDGACLTVTALDQGVFSVDVIGTTLERTIAGTYGSGTRVNLERALKLGARLDGHLVQGHVDGVGRLEQIVEDGEFWMLDFTVPSDVSGATILHGSIALNGVSLTVSEMPGSHVVRVGIIPYTWEHTNLGGLGTGDPVNVEGDLIGKYVARILATRRSVGTDL